MGKGERILGCCEGGRDQHRTKCILSCQAHLGDLSGRVDFDQHRTECILLLQLSHLRSNEYSSRSVKRKSDWIEVLFEGQKKSDGQGSHKFRSQVIGV